eukprot:1281813-Pyramimonas_sp.AAC.1
MPRRRATRLSMPRRGAVAQIEPTFPEGQEEAHEEGAREEGAAEGAEEGADDCAEEKEEGAEGAEGGIAQGREAVLLRGVEQGPGIVQDRQARTRPVDGAQVREVQWRQQKGDRGGQEVGGQGDRGRR